EVFDFADQLTIYRYPLCPGSRGDSYLGATPRLDLGAGLPRKCFRWLATRYIAGIGSHVWFGNRLRPAIHDVCCSATRLFLSSSISRFAVLTRHLPQGATLSRCLDVRLLAPLIYQQFAQNKMDT